jgi:hypothetical protein
MITTKRAVVSLYVDRTCPEHWIVRDGRGEFWMVPTGENSWERRQPFRPTEQTELEPIPGHYKYLLGLPG